MTKHSFVHAQEGERKAMAEAALQTMRFNEMCAGQQTGIAAIYRCEDSTRAVVQRAHIDTVAAIQDGTDKSAATVQRAEDNITAAVERGNDDIGTAINQLSDKMTHMLSGVSDTVGRCTNAELYEVHRKIDGM